MRAFGLGVLALAVGHLVVFDSWVELEGFTPLLNDRVPVFLAVIAAFYVSGYLFRAKQGLLEDMGAANRPGPVDRCQSADPRDAQPGSNRLLRQPGSRSGELPG